jgi:hypothetical protein
MAPKIHLGSKAVYAAGIIVLIVVFVIFILNSQIFADRYAQQRNLQESTKNYELNAQTFAVRRIEIKDLDNCQTLEYLSNGYANKFDCDNVLEAKKLFSNQTILTLLNTLTLEEFEKLVSDYFSQDLNLVITIETSHGTKTITINPEGSTPLPAPIEEIIDTSDELEEELDEPAVSPPPTPGPTPPPTPTPSLPPGATPTPTATPSPGPVDPADPFSCDMLDQQGVTVSNIRCLDDQ